MAVGAVGEQSASRGVDSDQSDNSAPGAGAAYVFVRDATGVWTQQAYIKTSNHAALDYFGHSVALTGDLLAVGAERQGNYHGAVYVFARSASKEWSQEAFLKASDPDENDDFGTSVAISGGSLAVGAGWEDSGSTGVDGDERNRDAPGSGAVYVFERDHVGRWTQETYIKASNTEYMDAFGRSVALSGNVLVVGASAEDSSAIGINGDHADNNASASGAVYVFMRNTAGRWSQQAYVKASNTGIQDGFGRSIAIDGGTVAVSSIGEASAATGIEGDQSDESAASAGAIYVFQ